MKDVDLGEPTSFLDHVYLGCTQRECHTNKDIVEQACLVQGNLKQTFRQSPMTWKVMRRNAWKEIANWRTKQLNRKSQYHASVTINLKKKKLDQSEKCQKFAHKLFWNACIWLVLVDLIFCGHNIVTNAWRVWSHTFVTHMNTGNIVMWETQHNSADLDCFKTLTSREILKTRSQHHEEFCAFSKVTRSCQ